jgi:hypothetical protein
MTESGTPLSLNSSPWELNQSIRVQLCLWAGEFRKNLAARILIWDRQLNPQSIKCHASLFRTAVNIPGTQGLDFRQVLVA